MSRKPRSNTTPAYRLQLAKHFNSRVIKNNGDSITFNLLDYKNSFHHITFNCVHHGEFSAKPVSLLRAFRPCPVCQEEFQDNRVLISYVNRARAKHGNKFNYTKLTASMVRGITVKVKCPNHGWISISSVSHLTTTHGCGECNKESKETTEVVAMREKVAKAKQDRVTRINKLDLSKFINNDPLNKF